jgi:hypothetical protein
MFFKEKYLPTGVIEKLKTRFVAGGDGQTQVAVLGVTAEFEDSVNDLCIFGSIVSSQGDEDDSGSRLPRSIP